MVTPVAVAEATRSAERTRSVAPRAPSVAAAMASRNGRGAKPEPAVAKRAVAAAGSAPKPKAGARAGTKAIRVSRPKSAAPRLVAKPVAKPIAKPVTKAKRPATVAAKRSGTTSAATKRRGGVRAEPKPIRVVKIKELNAQGKCGAGTSVVHLFRVDEVNDGAAAVHLVFFDRHGWYCEHGRSCPAVDDVRKMAGSHSARTN